MYDTNAFYLYNTGYNNYATIGVIRTVNKNTITMGCGMKIPKEDFEKRVYKLNDEEVAIYRGELIKNLSMGAKAIKEMRHDIYCLLNALNDSKLVEINKDKLTETLNTLDNTLKELLAKTFTIQDKKLKFNKYVTSLVEEVESEW